MFKSGYHWRGEERNMEGEKISCDEEWMRFKNDKGDKETKKKRWAKDEIRN